MANYMSMVFIQYRIIVLVSISDVGTARNKLSSLC